MYTQRLNYSPSSQIGAGQMATSILSNFYIFFKMIVFLVFPGTFNNYLLEPAHRLRAGKRCS